MSMVRTLGRRTMSALILGLTLVSATTVSAQTVVATTLGPGRTFQGTSEYLIGGTTSSFQFIATSFVYSGPSGLLLDEVRLGLNTGSSRTYLVTLLRGTDLTTASTVTSWNYATTPAFPGYALVTLAASGSVPLVSTETYWLAVSGLGTVGGWSFGAPGTTRPIYVRDLFSTDWRSDGIRAATAYEVTVRDAVAPNPAVVPEPATYALLGTGLLALLTLRRRMSGCR